MVRAQLVIALAAAGCYRPASEAPCTVRCDDTACPASLECGADQICRLPGANDCTIVDASGPLDARSDAAPFIDAQANPVQLIQAVTNHGLASMLSVMLPVAPTPGDVVFMIGANNVGALQGPTGAGVGWVLASTADACANTEVWYGVSSGADATVTIQGSGTSDMWMAVSEWRGLDTTNLFDTDNFAAENGGANTAPAPGGITTKTARELVLLSVASMHFPFGTPTPGSWQPFQTTGNGSYSQTVWYQLTTTTGTFAPSVTPGSSCWGSVIAAFQAP